MKNISRLTQKAAMLVAAIALTGLMIVSCSKDAPTPMAPQHQVKEGYICPETSYTLWAGQNINAGTLTVWNDETNLYVVYDVTNSSLAMNEIHLWAGLDIELCPQNKHSNPMVGQFPYFANATSSTPAGSPLLTDPFHYEITIPLVDIGAVAGDLIYVAAHAAATSQTMWSAGTRFVENQGSWATYSDYQSCSGGGSK